MLSCCLSCPENVHIRSNQSIQSYLPSIKDSQVTWISAQLENPQLLLQRTHETTHSIKHARILVMDSLKLNVWLNV